MRTRRIVIGCRRKGSASTVAISPSGSAVPPDPASMEFRPVDLTWPPHLDRRPDLERQFLDRPSDPERPFLDRPSHPDRPFVSLPARPPGAAGSGVVGGVVGGGPAIPTPAPPPPGDRDLTLADLTADLTADRRDLSFDRNPGWPAEVDWSAIARAARGHSPRHARRVSPRAFVWTGAGVVAAVLLTILVTTISELLR